MRFGRQALASVALVLTGLMLLSGCHADAEGNASSADELDDTTEFNGQTADPPAVPSDVDTVAPRAGVAADVSPDEVVEEEDADAIVGPVVTEQHRALEDPDGVDWNSVVAVADEHLLDSIQVAVLEYAELGWTQVGTPELVSSTVLEYPENTTPPTARVEICLDHDDVDVVDADGVSLLDETAESRVRSILTVVYVEDRWVATGQDFLDDSSC